MKKNIIVSLAAIAFIFTSCSNSTTISGDKDAKVQSADSVKQNFALDTTKLAAGTVYYTCPMHPHVISDKPGKCPECGEMDLEPVTKQ